MLYIVEDDANIRQMESYALKNSCLLYTSDAADE